MCGTTSQDKGNIGIIKRRHCFNNTRLYDEMGRGKGKRIHLQALWQMCDSVSWGPSEVYNE